MAHRKTGMIRRLAFALALLVGAAGAARADTYFSDLTRAAIRGEAEKVEAILAWGADPNHRGWLGLSPLAAAMRSCAVTPAVVYALLKAGADVEARSGMGETPLMLAWQMGRREIAEMLLALGADPAARNIHGDSAEEYRLYFAGALPPGEFETLRYTALARAPRSPGGPGACAQAPVR